jgi:hypothetical protein
VCHTKTVFLHTLKGREAHCEIRMITAETRREHREDREKSKKLYFVFL